MRHYQRLDTITYNDANDTILVSSGPPVEGKPTLWLGREGLYFSVSAGYGPLEVALRPRAQDLITCLSQLRPTERVAATRLVGTGQAQLELGLTIEGELLIRTAIVADATGYFAINMLLAKNAAAELLQWLGVRQPAVP